MRLFFISVFALGVAALPARAVEDLQAREFVDGLAQQVITILQTTKAREAREAAFHKLLSDNADMRRVARFTLGPAARGIDKQDFDSFQNLLLDLIVKVYANRLGDYSNEKLVVQGVQQKGRNFIVASDIVFTSGREPIHVDWWVIQTKSGDYKLFDLRVLGIWLAQEQRETYSSVLRNNGGDIKVLLEYLQKQITGG